MGVELPMAYTPTEQGDRIALCSTALTRATSRRLDNKTNFNYASLAFALTPQRIEQQRAPDNTNGGNKASGQSQPA